MAGHPPLPIGLAQASPQQMVVHSAGCNAPWTGKPPCRMVSATTVRQWIQMRPGAAPVRSPNCTPNRGRKGLRTPEMDGIPLRWIRLCVSSILFPLRSLRSALAVVLPRTRRFSGRSSAIAASALLSSVSRNPQVAKSLCAEFGSSNRPGGAFLPSPQAIAHVWPARQGISPSDAEIVITYRGCLALAPTFAEAFPPFPVESFDAFLACPAPIGVKLATPSGKGRPVGGLLAGAAWLRPKPTTGRSPQRLTSAHPTWYAQSQGYLVPCQDRDAGRATRTASFAGFARRQAIWGHRPWPGPAGLAWISNGRLGLLMFLLYQRASPSSLLTENPKTQIRPDCLVRRWAGLD